MPRRRRPAAAPRDTVGTSDGIPQAVPLLAVLGLAILCLCTIPAMRKQQRLDRDHTRLRQETQAVAGEVERLRRQLRDGAEQAYLRTKATRALQHKGARYVEQRDARYPRSK